MQPRLGQKSDVSTEGASRGRHHARTFARPGEYFRTERYAYPRLDNNCPSLTDYLHPLQVIVNFLG